MDIKRTENVTVKYKNGIISVIGTTFAIEAKISATELSRAYWGSDAKGRAAILVKNDK